MSFTQRKSLQDILSTIITKKNYNYISDDLMGNCTKRLYIQKYNQQRETQHMS